MDTSFEENIQAQGFDLIIGVDEAGRGPLAGPVVAAAVSLRNHQFHYKIADSKTLSPRQREQAYHEILENAHVGVGVMSEQVIDQVNILQATFLAMTNAVRELMGRLSAADAFSAKGLAGPKVCLLIDGPMFRSDLPYAYRAVVQGDAKVISIACASIVAKVTRDRILQVYDRIFPEYGFKSHKGYPTPAHKGAIGRHGLSLVHRRSFRHSL